ncbi:MAG: hypothetical protein JRI22_18220 [Deltaproteobacteria bacterium]|nr:hypothetical protein [Deltaproteobacteria bacterium]
MPKNRRQIFLSNRLSAFLILTALFLTASASLSLLVRCTRVVDGDTVVVRMTTDWVVWGWRNLLEI